MDHVYVGLKDGILRFAGSTVQKPRNCFRRRRCAGMDLDYHVVLSTDDFVKAWHLKLELRELVGQKYEL